LSERRSHNFRRNILLEQFLSEFNADLLLSENRLIDSYSNKKMRFPLILVMGPLRSGTTLFTQWFANTRFVAYPTNLLSRFYQAPILGAKTQLLLTDPRYNFRDELGEFAQQIGCRSENGKTKGVLEPNEFWYFWRRFLSEPQRDVWSDEELSHSMDIDMLRSELIGMMDVFQKPFAAKGMLFNYNIPFLRSIFEKVLFIQIKRDPVANVASILEARKRQLGSEAKWYSFKIPEYELIKELEPVQQCAGQLFFINRAIEKGMEQLPPEKKMIVEYENFCRQPEHYYQELASKIKIESPEPYVGPERFNSTRHDFRDVEILSALSRFEKMYA